MGVEERLFYYAEHKFRKFFPLLIVAFVILLLSIPYYFNDDNGNENYNYSEYTPPTEYPEQDMKCPHYKTALFISSELEQVDRRMLMRETLFGITDNLIPCMKQDTTEIFYKFFIKKSSKKVDEKILFSYASERLEYYDNVEIELKHADWHQTLLEYVSVNLKFKREFT